MSSKKKRNLKPNKPAPQEPQRTSAFSPSFIVSLCLIALIILIYGQVVSNDFINLDDDQYVTKNIHVQRGITAESIEWAFTRSHSSNWHPLTWISHTIDVDLYGLSPFGHHLTNLLLHILNTLLLFFVLRRMTGSVWKSGFVAALFAVHPLHVESVAWVAERKDVLSTFFWLAAMLAYAYYAEKPNYKRYIPVFALLALGLMSKPMLVTLPLVLLVMDYWPLRRISSPAAFRKMVMEKVPLFFLSAASSVVTFIVQQSAGSVKSIPITHRLVNASVSYAEYLIKMIWPSKLAVYYPYAMGPDQMLKAAAAVVILAAVTYAAVRLRRDHPYILSGWLWYAIALVPVIGIVQVGRQAMADRYTYIPLTGIFFAIAWGVPNALKRLKSSSLVLTAASIAVIGVLSFLTWVQVGYWKDSITLYEHTLGVTKNNYIIENNLGNELRQRSELQGRTEAQRREDLDSAIRHFKKAIELSPNNGEHYNNLGMALESKGRMDEALDLFKKAAEISPNLQEAHYNIGSTLLRKGLAQDSIEYFLETLEINPDYYLARYNLAVAYYRTERYSEAWNEIEKIRSMGIKPPESFIEKLSKAMPDPGG